MTPEAELLQQLSEEIARGEVGIRERDEDLVTLVDRRYPFEGSKIDWARIPGAVVRAMSTATLDGYREEVEQFVDEIAESQRLELAQQIAVLSDGAMSIALTMRFGTFRNCLRRILDLPQHTYVVAVDGSWCMVFAMEGDVSFGYAPR